MPAISIPFGASEANAAPLIAMPPANTPEARRANCEARIIRSTPVKKPRPSRARPLPKAAGSYTRKIADGNRQPDLAVAALAMAG
jgi:hypothetical protein